MLIQLALGAACGMGEFGGLELAERTKSGGMKSTATGLEPAAGIFYPWGWAGNCTEVQLDQSYQTQAKFGYLRGTLNIGQVVHF